MQKKARGLSWKSAKQVLRGNETWWHPDLKADVAAIGAFPGYAWISIRKAWCVVRPVSDVRCEI